MKAWLGLLFASLYSCSAVAQETPTWRYYRLGNTGMQGDYNEAIWIGPDGDPYIGGYDPSFEEGGFAKFRQAENRWINFSNVDYPVIGHPDSTGTSRVRDIAPDANGRLWLATGRGALFFDPAVGAASLVRYDRTNSALPGGWTTDVDIAPDGTVWFVGYSTFWGDGGLTRYNPATNAWTHWDGGGDYLSVQLKPGGGYWVWTAASYYGYAWRFDSGTGIWTQLPFTGAPGEVVGMPGKDCVDDAGNFWALRLRQPGDWEALDYRTPNGTWVSPPPPYAGVTYDIGAFKAYGDRQALLTDGNSATWHYDGTSWTNLGTWRPGGFTSAVDIDAAGNIWVCGVGGAAKRNAQTGQWQRYRVTNTSNFDSFNRDLTIDPVNGYVYTGANAGAGVGGMVRFDGTRWTCWDQLTYGLGYDWPFSNDYCQALAYRPSNGRIALNPYWSYGIHEWTGSGFNALHPDNGAKRICEDSQGRLWVIGEYYSLSYYDGNAWTNVPIIGWGASIKKDPTRPGTVWAATDYEIKRTDGGTFTFSRTIDDFPGSATWFTGFAADSNGIVWVGTWTQFTSTGSTLIRLNANTGSYTTFRHDQGWPFPGEHVRPLAITPDGRLWMQYDSEYPSNDAGLCWYDGVNVGTFPAPPGGEPQWGGLPNSSIDDLEVRVIQGAYELWMSCVSRGIAVLRIPHNPTSVSESPAPSAFLLAQNYPNPFNPSTTISYQLPSRSHVTLKVFDLLGREVATVIDGVEEPGYKSVQFDGRSLASGTYFYQLRSDAFVDTKRFLLVR